MREIKFAWICRNIAFNEIHRVLLTDTMLLDGSYPTWIKSDNCEVIAKILPTGLKDKNGVEIYEGDIVKLLEGSPDDPTYGYYCEQFEVRWSTRNAGFDIAQAESNWPKQEDGYAYYGGVLNDAAYRLEVIGNIWENPELEEGR